MSKEKLKVETNGNELITTRKFNAPRKLVFEAHSDCKHLMNWWGPREWPTILLQNGLSRWWYMALLLERPGGNGRILGQSDI